MPLRALYEDQHPHICVIKPAQRGVSEFAINAACFALDQGATAWATGKEGLNVGYLFPTEQALRDFSKERVGGLVEESPHLERMFRTRGVGAEQYGGVGFKKVGKSYLYLRGAWSEAGLLSFACDVLILDEYDRMDPSAVALARRRLNASLVRREIDISTPTIPGKFIHALYQQSDKRAYEQPCPHCGEWVRYDFHRDVRADGEPFSVWQEWDAPALQIAAIALVCPACRAEVSDTDRCAEGRWYADEPRVQGLRGYQIPPLAFPMTDLRRLALAAISEDPGEKTEFWRSDLGKPYDAAGSRVTEALLSALSAYLPGGIEPITGPWLHPTMGVDVGARFHYRVSATHAPTGRRIVRAMGSVRSFDELDALMTRYQVLRCVIDAYPELHGARNWAAKWPGRVYRATYPGSAAVSAKLYQLNDVEMSVAINRTMALDGVYGRIAGAVEHWPARFCREREVVSHMTSPVRVVTKDAKGQEITSWEHTSPDHFFHSCGYDGVAYLSLIERPADVALPIFASGGATGW